MAVAWRIVKKKYANDALSGEGAQQFGGRWNTPGHAVVYAAGTLSGALLEILIHSDRQLLSHYGVFRLYCPKRIVLELEDEGLPEHWRTSPAPPELARIGDSWCIQRRSAVLRVPNAIVPLEPNYLINPTHKDYKLIAIEGPLDFVVDERLVV